MSDYSGAGWGPPCGELDGLGLSVIVALLSRPVVYVSACAVRVGACHVFRRAPCQPLCREPPFDAIRFPGGAEEPRTPAGSALLVVAAAQILQVAGEFIHPAVDTAMSSDIWPSRTLMAPTT